MSRYVRLAFIATTALSLAACQTTGTSGLPPASHNGVSIQSPQAAVPATTPDQATPANLVALEKAYKRDTTQPTQALGYAIGLRQNAYLSRAAVVLKPFMDDTPVPAGMHAEMSMIELSLENYDAAEKHAKAAVVQDPEDYEAYHNLGIALDAKKMHVEAERAFRKGLEHWQGDPTAIMNNLALNLATQGFVDEAVAVLEDAKAIAPDRIEIERNLRIIRTLNER